MPAINTTESVASASLLHDRQFLADLRQQMLRFANLQLSDACLAEDTVQDALAGALKNAAGFAAKAALKTWVFAILKNKIADALRRRQRLIAVEPLADDDIAEADTLNDLFDPREHWRRHEYPVAWGAPDRALQNSQFWQVFEACMNHLPAQQARAFMMREFLELSSAEICTELNLSTTNLNVILYRARVRLRECLENNWFGRGKPHVNLS